MLLYWYVVVFARPIYMTQRMQFNGSRIKLNKFRLMHGPIETMLVPEKQKTKVARSYWENMDGHDVISISNCIHRQKKKTSNDNTEIAEVVHQNAEMAIRTYSSIVIISPKHYHHHHHQHAKVSAPITWLSCCYCRYYISEKRASTASLQLLKILLHTYVYFYNKRSVVPMSVAGFSLEFFVKFFIFFVHAFTGGQMPKVMRNIPL